MCISWNHTDDYIACGGDRGLLKVIQLSTSAKQLDNTATGQSDVALNQTLEGHSGSIKVIVWNEKHQKLTTADDRGYINVWVLHNGIGIINLCFLCLRIFIGKIESNSGVWYEEMINSRNKSTVNSMKWSKDGNKICIAYNDGMVIVGSVDGNRLWSAEIKHSIVAVEWSPRDKLILLGASSGEIYVYDCKGNFQSKLKVPVALNHLENQYLVSIQWSTPRYDLTFASQQRSLAIIFQQGYLQLMLNERDKEPVSANLPIRVITAKWNPSGTVLALVAEKPELPTGERSMIYFINSLGEPIHTLKVPGTEARSCSWDSAGLRLVIAADYSIILTNIRMEYKWKYFSDTVVYSFISSESKDTCIAFWDTKSNEVHFKHVKELDFIDACKEYALIVHSCEKNANKVRENKGTGSPVDFTTIDWRVHFTTMNNRCVVVADTDRFSVWYFKTISQADELQTFSLRKSSRQSEKRITYQIDNASLGAAVEYTGPPDKKTVDSICCIHATDSLLLIAKKSGQLCKYKFPSLLVLKPSKLKSRPTKMTLNCTNTTLAYIDSSHVLRLFSLTNDSNEVAGFERRDVWDFKWSTLDPELLAVTEKNRLCIFKGTKAQVGQCNFSKDILCMDDIAFLQEPILFNARMCELSDVALRAIYLDDLIKDQKPNNVDYFLEIKTQPLQVATNFAKQKQLHELASFAEQTAHPAIWKLLSETAMLEWNFELAELAFIKLLDYNSIQFLRTLITISDEQLKRAEILSFLGDLEQAEKIYMNSDRIDLAIGLNQKYGNWTRVVELLRDDVGVENDTRLDQAYNAIGDQMAERNNWEQAAHYYELAHASEKLIQAYYLLDRFDDLRKLVDSLTDFDGLKKTAVLFSSGGLYNEAEVALLKCKECESNNLEMTNLSKQLTKLFKSHTQYQIVEQSNEITASKNIAQVVDAVRSCQKAGRYLEAAKLLHQLAKTDTVKTSGLSIMKQIHVLVALLIEEHKKRLKLKQSSKKDKDKTNNAILSDLLEDENKFENSNLIENAWKGAKAYHFYTLGQRFLYNGDLHTALKIANYLCNFEDIINPVEIYSFLALTSGHCGQFATCSKAFVKLEKLTSSNDTFAGENEYENLAFQIFKEHAVKDSIQDTFPCPTCSSEIPLHHTVCSNCDHSFSLCMVSGKTLLEPSEIWTCRRCCQLADKKSISDFSICVLCHNIND
ncbi:WD repeat-containing protein 35 [Trichinella spiralis]|uniref:WD repeat-containing protein 35 n=1 Tax=Trichinella spiralis TaxID=6334 RepID=A0A0V1BR27_TRISP|nr:WD repeat-containing protein 35 [Trichinella spiralis]